MIKIRKSGFRIHAACRLSLAIALSLGTTAVMAQAVTGGIYGHADKNQTILITSKANGISRTLKPLSGGKYSTTALNPGVYEVKTLVDGKVVGTTVVTVRSGLMSHVPSVSENAVSLSSIVVSARGDADKFAVNPIDTSTPELVSQFSSDLVNNLPVSRSSQAIALLQSNVNHDFQTTGSIGVNGATAAETRYFLNGFDITNTNTNVNSFVVPDEAIENTSIITAGSNAQWSNATGGLVLQSVKQGDNVFRAGADVHFTPATSRLLNPRGSSSVQPDGYPFIYNTGANHIGPNITEDYWASGPLVKNKLFIYSLVGETLPRDNVSANTTTLTHYTNSDEHGLFNLTWNMSNAQTLDLLGVYDRGANYTNVSNLLQQFDTSSVGASQGWTTGTTTTKYLIGDYNWLINQNLQLHLMAGFSQIRTVNDSQSEEAAGGANNMAPCASVVDPVTQVATVVSPTNVCQVNAPFDTLTHGYKGDLTWWRGDNKLQVGFQYYLNSSRQVVSSVKGGVWTYYDTPGAVLPNGSTVSSANGNYVMRNYFISGGQGSVKQKNVYVQDSWQMTPRWLVYGGVRYDNNTYVDGSGQKLLVTPSFSPRLGFSWDVHGDNTFKIGGTLGSYSVVEPTEFSTYNNAAANTSTFYTYQSIGADGAPVGAQQIGGPYVSNTGVSLPAYDFVANNVRPAKQYALNLYAQKNFTNGWSGLLSATGVDFKRLIEEDCDQEPINHYAQTHGYPNYDVKDAYNLCYDLNPGVSPVLTRDFGDGKLTTFKLPWSAFHLPGVKHRYYSLTAQISHTPTHGQPYFLRLGYTFQRSYGNVDGLLDLSHQAGIYIGRTQVLSDPKLAMGSNGNLGGDIRNTVVASGMYYFKSNWLKGFRIGGVFRWQSGAPLSCLGTYPDSTSQVSSFRPNGTLFCHGVLSRRGQFRLPPVWSLGVGVGYDWKIRKVNKLDISLKISNITNHQSPVNRVQASDTGRFISRTELVPNPAYDTVSAYQQPRTTMLVVRYRFN